MELTSPSGIAALNTLLEGIPIVVAPTDAAKFNTIKVPLIPVACWRVEDISFEFASSIPSSTITQGLRHLAQVMEEAAKKDRPDIGEPNPITVFGHADPVGEDEPNKGLAGRRAQAIYGLLTRDVQAWEDLYKSAHPYDDWDTRSLQVMLDAVSGTPGQSTAQHKSDVARRKQLFGDYMNKICPPELAPVDKKKGFLAQGVDAGGKGDYQGCGEFNPVMVFSQTEENKFAGAADKTERNSENTVNRRVVVLIFRKGSKVEPAKWPCPKVKEGTAGCKKRFFSDGENRRTKHLVDERRLHEKKAETFACRFYERVTDRSPCERIAPVPLVTQIHMFVDADRDGKVDDDWNGSDKWEWGTGKKGAIVLCNNDDDGGRTAGASGLTYPRLDNGDNAVNGAADVADLAPLVIRRTGPMPSGWEVFLQISTADVGRLRIFDSRSAGAREVIGPTSGTHRWRLPDISFTEKELGIEAVRYPADFRPGAGNDHSSFAGEISITLEILVGGAVTHTEAVVVRIAPWIMPSHLDAASRVYVIATPTSVPPGAERTSAAAQLPNNSQFINELRGFVSAAGCTLVTRTDPDRDRWIQDAMEIGWSASPNHHFPIFARSSQNRGSLSFYPLTLSAADRGYLEQGAMAGGTYDSNGNLEATPPCTVGPKRYPFGRIYYGAGTAGHPGDSFDPKREQFLKLQVVQEPFAIDTDWLSVGHVDEVVSILPGGGSQGFKVAVASPRRAYGILDASLASSGSARLLTGRKFRHGGTWVSAEVSIADFLGSGIPSLGLVAADLRRYNLTDVQGRINGIVEKFRDQAGVQVPADILEIPVIFMPDNAAAYAAGMSVFADALTADSVNMLVINQHCVIPMPFGPVVAGVDLFRQAIETDLTALGLTLHFIDDWYEYHIMQGEVHCGTNTLRSPTRTQWWEYVP